MQDAIYAAPIESVAFLCHFNVLPMQDELVRPTRARVQRVTHTTIGICVLLYTAIALTGYFRFTSSTCGDYLNNFPNDDAIVTVGRIGLLLTLYCSFPLVVLPCRSTFSRLLNIISGALSSTSSSSLPEGNETAADTALESGCGSGGAVDDPLTASLLSPMGSFVTDSPAALSFRTGRRQAPPGAQNYGSTLNGDRGITTRSTSAAPEAALGSGAYDDAAAAAAAASAVAAALEPSDRDSNMRHIVLTVLVVGGSLVIALQVQSVVTIWSIAGSTVAMMIAYVLPSVFYIRLRAGRPCNRRIVAAWVLLVGSVILMGLSTWQAVLQIARPNCPARGH